MASETKKPTEAMMEAGWERNPWGAGVAWQETNKKGKVLMRWEKGIQDVKDVIKLVAKRDEGAPIVVHFRVPTEGLEDVVLTHPFPITTGAELDFSGTVDGHLLFHNGGWGNWRPFSLDTCLKRGLQLPKGMLNDSRMMAWNAAIYGIEVLQLIDEKVIVFGADGIQLFGTTKHNPWEYLDGIWFSNGLWKSCLPKPAPTPVPHREATPLRQLTSGASGGERHQETFRTHGESGNGGQGVEHGDHLPQQVEGQQKVICSYPEQGGEGQAKRGRVTLTESVILKAEYHKLHGTSLPNIKPLIRMGFSPIEPHLTM